MTGTPWGSRALIKPAMTWRNGCLCLVTLETEDAVSASHQNKRSDRLDQARPSLMTEVHGSQRSQCPTLNATYCASIIESVASKVNMVILY